MTLPKPEPVSLNDDDVTALLLAHHGMMRAATPEESCHVMDPGGLQDAGARMFGIRFEGELLGVGALVEIADGHGEVKSMHTASVARGRGIGRDVLRHLVKVARGAGMTRLSLETGSAEMFFAARQLYLSEGFELCPPFGDYALDPLSVFMTRQL